MNITKYGDQLFECQSTPKETLKKRIMFLAPAIVFILAGIAYMANPEVADSQSQLMMLLALFFGTGVLFILLSIILVKPLKAVIYEGGLVYIRGEKTKEFAFDSVKDISDETTTFLLWGLIPTVNIRAVKLVLKDGGKAEFTKYNVSDFHNFADELGEAFEKYSSKA